MGRQGKSGSWRRKFKTLMSLNWVWDVSLCLRVLIVISMFQLMIKSDTNFVFWKKYNLHHLSAEHKFQDPQWTSVTSHSIKPYIHNGFSIQTYLWGSLFYIGTVRDWQLPNNNRKVKVKSLSRVQLFATRWMDCSLLCSSVDGISQARILQWGAISFSRDRTQFSQIVANTLPSEPPGKV